MDASRFDALLRLLADPLGRRRLSRVLLGLTVGERLSGLDWTETEAKNKHKKKRRRKKKRCKGDRPVKCGKSCIPSDSTCCLADPRGFGCPPSEPKCCPGNLLHPDGSCTLADFDCCTLEGGGACPAGTFCCPANAADPSAAGCCLSLADCCDSDLDCAVGEGCFFGCCEAL